MSSAKQIKNRPIIDGLTNVIDSTQELASAAKRKAVAGVNTVGNVAVAGVNTVGNAAVSGVKIVGNATVSGVKTVGNAGVSSVNLAKIVKDYAANKNNSLRESYNASKNYTGKRSKYKFKDDATNKDPLNVTAKVSLDKNNYVKVTLNEPQKLNESLELWKPDKASTTPTGKWTGGSTRRKKVKKRVRRKHSYRKKSPRRKRL